MPTDAISWCLANYLYCIVVDVELFTPAALEITLFVRPTSAEDTKDVIGLTLKCSLDHSWDIRDNAIRTCHQRIRWTLKG